MAKEAKRAGGDRPEDGGEDLGAEAAPVAAFLHKRVPVDWFDGPCEVRVDREEVLAVGSLPEGTDPDDFRDQTRQDRMRIATEAQRRFGRVVSWGVRTAEGEQRFTVAAVPAMTRLRFDERAVLDTLIEAGVARSRSEALVWCVRHVAAHEADWLAELRAAAEQVRQVARRGPRV